MCVCVTSNHVYHVHAWYLWKPEEDVAGPETGVREHSVLNLGLLQEKGFFFFFFTIEPSLLLCIFHFELCVWLNYIMLKHDTLCTISSVSLILFCNNAT